MGCGYSLWGPTRWAYSPDSYISGPDLSRLKIWTQNSKQQRNESNSSTQAKWFKCNQNLVLKLPDRFTSVRCWLMCISVLLLTLPLLSICSIPRSTARDTATCSSRYQSYRRSRGVFTIVALDSSACIKFMWWKTSNLLIWWSGYCKQLYPLLQIQEWVAPARFRKNQKEQVLNFSEHLKTFKMIKNSLRTSKSKIPDLGKKSGFFPNSIYRGNPPLSDWEGMGGIGVPPIRWKILGFRGLKCSFPYKKCHDFEGILLHSQNVLCVSEKHFKVFLHIFPYCETTFWVIL